MDTKSKKYHKLAVGLIILIILLPSLAMMVIRPHYIKDYNYITSPEFNTSSFMSLLVNSNYVLYAEEKQLESQETMMPFDIFFPSALQEDSKKSEASSENTANDSESPSDSNADPDAEETDSSASSQELSMDYLDEETYPDAKYKSIYGFPDQDFSSDDAIIQSANEVSRVYSHWESYFSRLRSYVKYEVTDSNGKTLDSNSGDSIYKMLSTYNSDTLDDQYAFGAVISYDKAGNVENAKFFSGKTDNATQVLNEELRVNPFSSFSSEYNMTAPFQKPQNRTYTYLMTAEDMDTILSNDWDFADYMGISQNKSTEDLFVVFITLAGIVAAAALFLPFIPCLETGEEKIFHAPFEFVLTACSIALGVSTSVSLDGRTLTNQSIYNVLNSIGVPERAASALQYIWGLMGWAIIFAVYYWSAGCLRSVFTLDPKRYIQERVIIYRIWPLTKRFINYIKRIVKNVYTSLLHINLRDDTNRVLIKVVLINFIILGFISLLWFWGIGALLVYSVALFFLLRKYCEDLKKQYERLLSATNQLAEGNLNGTIPEDLGVFEPFREEISRIQTGFKKAVDEEVKSQKMKADLITNVSHDLKTPLTAIISYVDLLKSEDITEEERKRYINILDQKSARLKVLIEDLFEVSKATSRSVTLNIMDVDIVSLMQQVKLELQDKIESSNLYFRWRLPEEKVILPLDSQKTYRVFENLLINITKYAMPRTRVYVDMENDEERIRITMKNISASELNFNPADITERFVRGDSSRNTEGSGLGLAIAKSFVELQGGSLEVMVDADLFTVEIIFLK